MPCGTCAPILLMGPTGAGKSRLARQIYALRKQHEMLPTPVGRPPEQCCGSSPGGLRGSGPFVEVNCAMLRGDMAMSTLFGHRKGAFTGSTGDRAGLLQAADGGILFLDEIGELGPDEQAMLLRAVEDKRYLPVGSDQEVESTFQLISGTNRDLRQEVASGRFREDLLARIKFWSFRLPGLAERREDIEPNIAFELQRRSREVGKPVSFSAEARKAFLGFATSREALWPANFRDLNSSIARMAILADGNRIGTEDVGKEVARLQAEWKADREGEFPKRERGASRQDAEAAHEIADLIGEQASSALDLFDRVQLEEVISTCKSSSSLADAGRRLFSESRKQRRQVNDSDRLRKYLQRFGISWEMLSPR